MGAMHITLEGVMDGAAYGAVYHPKWETMETRIVNLENWGSIRELARAITRLRNVAVNATTGRVTYEEDNGAWVLEGDGDLVFDLISRLVYDYDVVELRWKDDDAWVVTCRDNCFD